MRVHQSQHFGQGAAAILSAVTSAGATEVQDQATQYAEQFYQDNQTAILLSLLAMATWMIWVSTRKTN